MEVSPRLVAGLVAVGLLAQTIWQVARGRIRTVFAAGDDLGPHEVRTFRRSREPVRFWMQAGFQVVGGLILLGAAILGSPGLVR